MCTPCKVLFLIECCKYAEITLKNFLLTHSFHQDLNWFNTFLSQYNGVTYFDIIKVYLDVHLNASLQVLVPILPNGSCIPLADHFKALHIT